MRNNPKNKYASPLTLTLIFILLLGACIFIYTQNGSETLCSSNDRKCIDNLLLEQEARDRKTYKNEEYGFEFKYPSGVSNEFLEYISLSGIIGIPTNAPQGFIETIPTLDSAADSFKISKFPVEISSTVIDGQEARIVIDKNNGAYCSNCFGDQVTLIISLPKPLTFEGETNAFLILGNANISADIVPVITSTFKFIK